MRKEKRLWMIILKEIEYHHKRGTRGLCNLMMTLWNNQIITTDEYEWMKERMRVRAIEQNVISSFNQIGFFWPVKDLESRVSFIKKIIKK